MNLSQNAIILYSYFVQSWIQNSDCIAFGCDAIAT